MKAIAVGTVLVSSLLILIFFPTQDDLSRDFSFYNQTTKVKIVGDMYKDAEKLSKDTDPEVSQRVYDEESGTFKDVPVKDAISDKDFTPPSNAYMPLLDPDLKAWRISSPPGVGVISEYGGEYGYGYSGHTGWDLPAPSNTAPQVYSAKAGLVLFTDNQSLNVYYQDGKPNPWGTTVVIGHADGTVIQYAHLTFNSLQVKVGDNVKAGALLGKMGNTGNSSAQHLHMETRSATSKLPPLTKENATAWINATGYGAGHWRSCTYFKSLCVPQGTYKPTDMKEDEVPKERWNEWKEAGV